VPLFTLLIGYTFGRQQRENGNNKYSEVSPRLCRGLTEV
jgi:hypothetical protein